MHFFFRYKDIILLLIFVVLFPVFFFLLWRGLTIINIGELWTQSGNRVGILVNLAAAIAYGLITSIILLFRQAITSIAKSVLFPNRTEEDRLRTAEEQLYLDNLIDRFKKELPWEVEKFSALEAIQEARRVQTKLWHVQHMNETRTEGNLGSRVDLLSFLRQEKGPVMLKGDPGTGKTLTMRRLAVDQAQALKRTPKEGKIPLYISLALYTGKTTDGQPEPIFDFLQRYLQEEFPSTVFLREHLTEYLTRGRLLLLFDGLNELPLDEYMARYTKLEEFVFLKYPRNKAIFTCRTLRYTSTSKFQTVAISDLDNDQIKRFITVYLGSTNAEDLYRQLASGDGFMLRICRNPFMLHMLVTRDATRSVPQSPAQLFEEYVQDSLSKVSQIVTGTIDVLREIAFIMQKRGKFAGVVSLEWLKAELPHFSPLTLQEHVEIAYKAKLVDYTIEKKIRFYHQILQEYFAATALQREWQEGKDLDEYFKDYKWEDTILVCTGITQNPEQFISQIWSPGKDQPEAFWLATKAVGMSGRHISKSYYGAILGEAKTNLDIDGKINGGYSRTVLAVDTIKALSYIDDDNTTELLSSTLTSHSGWIRELCIQVLGNSRNPSARTLLRKTVISLRSIPILLFVSPYFTRREWLSMTANSALSLSLLIRSFWILQRYLWMLTPGLYMGLVYLSSQLFKVDPIFLIGRAVALTSLAQLLSAGIGCIVLVIRSQDTWQDKFALLKNIVLNNAFFIVFHIGFIAALWFFAGEVSALLAIVLILLYYLYVIGFATTILFNLRAPLRTVHLLYSKFGRTIMLMDAIISLSHLISFFMPSTYKIPSIKVVPHISSFIEKILWYIFDFLLNPIIYQAIFYLAFILGFFSLSIYILTFTIYWYLRKNRKSFMRKGNKQAALRIIRVALNSSSWFHARERAFKELRLIDVPFQYVKELDNLLESNQLQNWTYDNLLVAFFADNLDLRGELERTIYELLARAREEEREAPNEEYILALFNRGNIRYQAGYHQEALTYLSHVLSLNPKHVPTLITRGQIYERLQQFSDALKDFNEAIASDNHNVTAFAYRGRTYYDLSRYPEAVNDLTQAIQLNFKEDWIYIWRGDAYGLLQDYHHAIADFDQAIHLDPQDAWAYARRGKVYRLLQNYHHAIADFDQAIHLDPQDAWAYAERGETHRLLQDYHHAIADFDQAIHLDPQDAWAYAGRGKVYCLLQDYHHAIADFDQAIQLDEKADWYRYRRAQLYWLTSQMTAFETDMRTAITLADENLQKVQGIDTWNIRFHLALYHLASGNEQEAKTQYTELLSTCSVLSRLRAALKDISNLLILQPSHTLAQQITTHLHTRITELEV